VRERTDVSLQSLTPQHHIAQLRIFVEATAFLIDHITHSACSGTVKRTKHDA
jgi:hypothetical protein